MDEQSESEVVTYSEITRHINYMGNEYVLKRDYDELLRQRDALADSITGGLWTGLQSAGNDK